MKDKFTPNYIESLEDNEVFVFGSNLEGHHIGGAARIAKEHFGAVCIIRKTKCFRIWERNAIISKTKRNFSRLYPTPQNFKKIDRLRRNEIHLKAVRTPS